MPSKRGRSNQKKRKNSYDGVGKQEKRKKNMSDSCEHPISAGRNLNPKSTTVFHARRSLRSCTRLLEIGTTSLEQMGEINVGKSTLGVPEKVGESGEAEAVHIEQDPLVDEIQAETTDSASFKLTEMINMVRNEEDDEVDSNKQSMPEDTVNGYKVEAELLPILSKIIEKYGDIAKNCKTRSVQFRSMFSEKICRIVSELETKNITNIKEKDLENHIALVQDIKTYKFEVKWLHTRLTEILDAKRILRLKKKSDNNKELIVLAMSTLKTIEEQKKEAYEQKMEASEKLKEASEKFETVSMKEADWKERLYKSRNDSTKISQEVKAAASKVKRFLNCSLVDDLL